jgi:hypothetical protein
MSNRILSWSRLNTEYLKWSKDNGEGRDKNDLRFGQYLYIKYDLSEYSVDPFYPEGCENIYAMLARDLHDRYLKDMRKDIDSDINSSFKFCMCVLCMCVLSLHKQMPQ